MFRVNLDLSTGGQAQWLPFITIFLSINIFVLRVCQLLRRSVEKYMLDLTYQANDIKGTHYLPSIGSDTKNV